MPFFMLPAGHEDKVSSDHDLISVEKHLEWHIWT